MKSFCAQKGKIEFCEDYDEIFTKFDAAQWMLVLVVMHLVVKYSNKLFCSKGSKLKIKASLYYINTMILAS